MGADYFFRMGSTHAICQDYALAGEACGIQYALLADGCSGVPLPGQPGSPHTDWGARFLVRAARLRLDELARGTFASEAIIHHCASLARVADLSTLCLDATLLAAVATEKGDFITYQTGDGVIAGRRRDGSLFYRSLSFGNGMPFYLSYLLTARHLEQYLDPDAREDRGLRDVGTVQVIENRWNPSDGWQPSMPGEQARLSRADVLWRDHFSREEYEVVVLLSDGVESFLTREQQVVPLETVLEHLLDFKGYVGQFIVRRATRFLEKVCAENGWRHTDDFAIAGIHLSPP